MLTFLLLTGNKGKQAEFTRILQPLNVQVDIVSLDLPEIQSLDIEEIGNAKVWQAWEQLSQMPSKLPLPLSQYHALLTDDVSLTLDAIKPLPGPFIKWFLASLTLDEFVTLAKNYNNMQAQATCLLSLFAISSQKTYHFQAHVDGLICPPVGDFGFGWDACFQPVGSSLSFAQMTKEEKNKISHRSLACEKLVSWLKENNNLL